MVFESFDVPGLSHYSYIVGCGGAVAVIDPKRDIDTYLEFAKRTGLRIAYVLETHTHADYASGARALADATGAELYLSAYGSSHSFGNRPKRRLPPSFPKVHPPFFPLLTLSKMNDTLAGFPLIAPDRKGFTPL
jgi:glyoxylase-like metal-dependent hydrolase (beta-lactamase superfamily II)